MKRQRGQVLIILFGSMLFGAGAIMAGTLMTGKPVKELRKDVKVAIADKNRRKEIIATLDDWESTTKPHLKKHGEIWDGVFDKLKDHEAQRSDFDALLQEADENNGEALRKGIEGRRGFKDKLTKEEWLALFGD